MGIRVGKQKFVSGFYRRILPLFQTVVGGVLFPVALGTVISINLFQSFEKAVESRKREYVLQERQVTTQKAEEFSVRIRMIRDGLRAFTNLPEFQELDSSSSMKLSSKSQSAAKRIYSELSQQYGVRSVVLSHIDILTSKKNPRNNRPWTFAQRFSNFALPERVVIRSQMRAVREQLDWLQQRHPLATDLSPISYPSSISEPVPMETYMDGNDTIRTEALLYTIPIYGKEGQMLGGVSAVIPKLSFDSAVEPDNAGLVNVVNRTVYGLGRQGTLQREYDFFRSGTPLPTYIYSESLPVKLDDTAGYWKVWRTLPDSEFFKLPLYKNAKNSFAYALSITWLGVIVAILLIRRMKVAQERRFQSMVRNSHEVILVIDEEGIIEHVVGQTQSQLGWKNEELRRLDLALFIHPECEKELEDMVRRVHAAPYSTESCEVRLEQKEGGYPWFEATASNMKHLPGVGDIVLTLSNIESRKNAEVMLLAAKEAAEAANQAKTEFLSRMSHELRTPLNAILGFGQLLEMSHLEDRDKEGVDQILKAGRHLLDVVNDILDIARIETQNLTLSVEPQRCDEVMAEAIGLIQPMAGSHGITIEFEHPGELFVMADRQRIKQIIINLLSNAIKYNRENGSVHIFARQSDQFIRICIEDTGKGINPTLLKRLFTPFDRLGADKSDVDGVGIGLSLCKTLVEAMNGRIDVDTTEGVGSVFTVVLPAGEPQSIEASYELINLESVNHKKKVLYVEDNLTNLKLVRDILQRRNGYELITAIQGGIGIEMAEMHVPDLILLDLDLPDIPGIEVLRVLRQNEATKHISVIVMSADNSQSKREQVLQFGSTKYLTKPLDIIEFIRLLQSQGIREPKTEMGIGEAA
jgi:PAS domain S-box-containing protein